METTGKTKPTILVIFGGTGDLSWRKLIPALFNLYIDKWLNQKFSIVCIGRKEMEKADLLEHLRTGVDKFSRRGKAVENLWSAFSEGISYLKGNFDETELYTTLKEQITVFQQEASCDANKIFYLAVPPQFFEAIATNIGVAGLAQDAVHARLVIEKPFGTDLKTARQLNTVLSGIFKESQLYRIDHYLGKETVQNIMAFRFANALFEPIWNQHFIDHVQITVSESLGIETRGNYYETSGALRDMIQNHLLQLLCLIAMEPPVSFEADEVRNRKVDVLRALRRIKKEDVHSLAVRGQYDAGNLDGKKLKAYREEQDVPPDSPVETFAALKLHIDNWRWSGVPFYLRTGKRLHESISVITIQFRPAPHQTFPDEATENWQPNRMILNLQPDMGIRIRFQAKKPRLQMQLNPVDMLFDYSDAYSSGMPDGYETLLLDVIEGDATLFMRADQVEAAWEVLTPVLETWLAHPSVNFPNYKAGSNGPEAAEALIAKDGRSWIIMPFKKEKT